MEGGVIFISLLQLTLHVVAAVVDTLYLKPVIATSVGLVSTVTSRLFHYRCLQNSASTMQSWTRVLRSF